MKLIYKSTFSLLFALFFVTSSYAVTTVTTDNGDKGAYQLMRETLTIDQIASMDRKEIEQAIGRKLTLKERGGLVLGKHRINYLSKKGYDAKQINGILALGDFDFNIWGFLLGFFLSLLGILIAWLVFGSSGLKSSVFGALFNALLVWLAFRRR